MLLVLLFVLTTFVRHLAICYAPVVVRLSSFSVLPRSLSHNPGKHSSHDAARLAPGFRRFAADGRLSPAGVSDDRHVCARLRNTSAAADIFFSCRRGTRRRPSADALAAAFPVDFSGFSCVFPGRTGRAIGLYRRVGSRAERGVAMTAFSGVIVRFFRHDRVDRRGPARDFTRRPRSARLRYPYLVFPPARYARFRSETPSGPETRRVGSVRVRPDRDERRLHNRSTTPLGFYNFPIRRYNF